MSARAVVCAAALLACARACYWNNKCTYAYYGSKTVYNDVRGDIRDVPGLKGCEPAAIWALIRHGTRHPSSTNVGNMRDAAAFKTNIVRSHLEGRGEMCAQDISNLQSWSWWDIIASTPGHLTKEGFGELYDLGARFNERFLPLLQDLDQYHFRPTLEQRTIESAKAFVEGLSQGYMKFEQENATDRDDVLRPYLYCTKHNVEVYNGPRSTLEMEKYHETEEFQLLLKDVQKRIGLDEPLTPTNVSGLYDLCRFFRAFAATRTSPWCALFSDQELERLEYLNDLRHYYRNGYGSAINMKLGRPTLKDLFQNFQDVVQGSRKSFTGYFSHDSTLQMVYSALGLFRDYPEISGFERIPSRKWRTSFMTPFAGNFVAILHKCSNGSTDYQVQFFINEVKVHLCNARICSWKEFIEKFEPFANSNLEFCDLDNSSTTTARALNTVISLKD